MLCAQKQKNDEKSITIHKKNTSNKFCKDKNGSRALVTASTSSVKQCTCCKGWHALYSCSDFASMTIPRRWDLVKSKKLCKNCLRHHGECTSLRCKHCGRFHHSLLHHFKPASSIANDEQTKTLSANDNSKSTLNSI